MESAETDHKRKKKCDKLGQVKKERLARVGDKVDRLQLVGQGHHQQKTRPGKEEKRKQHKKETLIDADLRVN